MSEVLSLFDNDDALRAGPGGLSAAGPSCGGHACGDRIIPVAERVTESKYSVILIRRGGDLIMAIVSTCTYDSRGKLVSPDALDISRAKIRLDLDTGEKPTFDRGHLHVYVVSDMGVTAEQARERVSA
ncbi:hypothetical protein [Streptomyces sp. NPDC059788]|uniref:hypothetical protein n=1 Tax=Streptomyces sp. NPDC059788 TaxID=3346948 RepID=UPI00365CCF3D